MRAVVVFGYFATRPVAPWRARWQSRRRKKSGRPSPQKVETEQPPSPELAKKGKKIKEDIDKLLDEIDDILGRERRGVREELRAARRRVGMPIYEYRCKQCEGEFEKYVAGASTAVACPVLRQRAGDAQAVGVRSQDRRRAPVVRHVRRRRWVLRRRLRLSLSSFTNPVSRLMDLRRLEIFAKVAELGSFSRAAEALFLTQPTISEHIRALEDELGRAASRSSRARRHAHARRRADARIRAAHARPLT